VRRKRKKSWKLKFLLIFLSVVFLSLVYIWQRVTVLTLSTRIKQWRWEIQQQRKVQKYLQIEVTELSSIQRIEAIANQMGFVYPPLDQIGWIQEIPDSTFRKKEGVGEKVWAKLKMLKRGIFIGGDKVEAKEIRDEKGKSFR